MIKKNSKYKPLYNSDKRYFVITGGRNSGKSHGVSTFTVELTYEQHHNIIFTRYTMASANKSIIPELTAKIEDLECKDAFNITNNEIFNLLTDSKIYFSGIKTSSGNQTANLKSLHETSTWVLDEAEEMQNESEFDKIDLSIRSVKVQNRIILILNPTTKEHWIWKRWFENSHTLIDVDGVKIPISTHPEVCHIHTTYLDNIENIPEDYLRQITNLKLSNPDKYKHVILGGWLNKAEGVIFNNWSIGEFDNSIPYYFGQDYGFSIDPSTLVKVAINKQLKKIYINECFYKKAMNTGDIEVENKRYAGEGLIIADCAEPRLIDELKKRGCNIKAVTKGTISSDISILQDYELVVTENSINVIKELNNYSWSDKKSGTPIDAFNHAIDAIRYGVMHQLINPEIKRMRPLSFGVERK